MCALARNDTLWGLSTHWASLSEGGVAARFPQAPRRREFSVGAIHESPAAGRSPVGATFGRPPTRAHVRQTGGDEPRPYAADGRFPRRGDSRIARLSTLRSCPTNGLSKCLADHVHIISSGSHAFARKPPKLSTKCRQLESKNGNFRKKFPFLRRLNVKGGLPSTLHNPPMRVGTLPHGRRVVYSLSGSHAFAWKPLFLTGEITCCK